MKRILKPILLLGLLCYPLLSFSAPINKYASKKKLNLHESPIKNIDGIVCINLDRRVDKWLRMQKIFAKHNIPISKFSGIDGWLDLDYDRFDEDCIFQPKKRSLTPGEKGCLLSHFSVWKKALKKDLNTIWILEDDVEIYKNPHNLAALIDELNQIDPDWDMLFTDDNYYKNYVNTPRDCRGNSVLYPNFDLFYAMTKERDYPILNLPDWYGYSTNVSKNLKTTRGRFGLHSIIFSKKGLKKVVKHFEKTKFIFGADVEIYFAPKIKMYATKKSVVGQHFETTISDTSFRP